MEKKLLLCLVLLSISVAKAQYVDCPAGYQEIDGSCYYFSKVAKNSRQAIATCEAQGGELLEVDDDATRAIIDNYASRCVYWISAESQLIDYWQNEKKEFKFICHANPAASEEAP
ncbi:perlucin-like protein [Branchiostoma floridae]|uniref:Perlucin-like protein n=1 Tax=Branchiostoma floridae TaxID=7739 RepID=A0A9J7MZS8_BRAFL|nr:perlucin-like protein [Branchiostoma floridae]